MLFLACLLCVADFWLYNMALVDSANTTTPNFKSKWVVVTVAVLAVPETTPWEVQRGGERKQTEMVNKLT